MRFIVFLDLLGTIILPATTVYLVYLIITVSTTSAPIPYISLAMIGAVYGLQMVIFLLKRQWQYMGWLLFYLLAFPIWSFFLPIYSFWHMDDFSWGNTRIVVGEKGNKKIVAGTDEEPYDDSMIPVKKFSDYQRQIGHLTESFSGRTTPIGWTQAPFTRSGVNSVAASEYGSRSDYFQNTNILAKGNTPSRPSSNYSLRASGIAHDPSQVPPMTYTPPIPMYTPSPSIYGMPSMYGMPPTPLSSMYGMPNSQSMIGVPSGWGMPAYAQSSPGSEAPLPAVVPPLTHRSRGSASTLLSMTNPFTSDADHGAATLKLANNYSTQPTDNELVAAVETYLLSQPDLMKVSKRDVREAVIASFPNANLEERKVRINSAIDETLSQSK